MAFDQQQFDTAEFDGEPPLVLKTVSDELSLSLRTLIGPGMFDAGQFDSAQFDAPPSYVDEIAALAVLIAGADVLNLSLAELGSVLVTRQLLAATDSLGLTLTEAAVLVAKLSANDTAALSIAEAASSDHIGFPPVADAGIRTMPWARRVI